ncbi:MAG: AsnC family transcriptional regulator [Gammaproteobacteria bacterium]|nr:AsnC family transcriptional regulator [Gammaproteobacteria bacterium]
MDQLDKNIINTLQYDFPICDRPFARLAETLNSTEDELINRVQAMLDSGLLTRFGPMYNAVNMGGALSLCAMKVPEEKFNEVTEQVNAFAEVAHNYQRDHEMNMWFVLATESQQELNDTLNAIENSTGIRVYNMPKEKEFFVGLHFKA